MRDYDIIPLEVSCMCTVCGKMSKCSLGYNV